MRHTKPQSLAPLLLEKKIFEGFLPYMGVAAILVMWPRPRENEQLSFPHPTEAPYDIWLWLAQRFWRRRSLKMVDGRRTTDGQRTDDGLWLYYKLINEPKGSGKLKKWRHRFPQYKSMRAFCCHGNQSFDPICPKTLCSLFPTPVMLDIKCGQLASEIFKFECVDDGRRRTDDGPLVYYKLTVWAFGSGELKEICHPRNFKTPV